MNTKSMFTKEWFSGLGKSLKFALYCCVHPFDGFWDITREKKGSLAAANVIMLLLVFQEVFRLMLSSFVFVNVYLPTINIWFVAAGVVFPLLLWALSNWSLTTLMDGKGRLQDVYMATMYAFTPKILIGYPLIILSHVLTEDEGAIYFTLEKIALIWSILLVLSAMMMIHDYSLGKAVFSSIITIVGIAVIVFILILFFSLISDGIAYFVSIYKEIAVRMY